MLIKAKANVQWPRYITFNNIIEKTTYRDLQAGKTVKADGDIAVFFMKSGLVDEVPKAKIKNNESIKNKGD